MTKHASRFAAVVLLSLAVTVPAAAQVSPQREAQLIQQTAQFPRELAPYLELARMYFDQGRFEDAERALSQAMGVVQRVRATSLASPAQVAGLIESRTLLTGGTIPLPPGTVRVGGDIKQPIKIRDIKPVYPAEAQAAKISGIVIIEVVIDREGAVGAARVLRTEPMLEQAALDAVRQWRFMPTLVNGVATPVVMTVTVNFTLQ